MISRWIDQASPMSSFTASDGSAVAVEVKLREPYGRVSNPFADKYFVTKDLWDGLPNLEGARTVHPVR